MSLRQQVEALIKDNLEKYPDAIDLFSEQVGKIDIANRKTRYEKFVLELSGNDGEFFGHPFNPRLNNMKELVVWYIHKHNCDASYAIEQIKKNINNLP